MKRIKKKFTIIRDIYITNDRFIDDVSNSDEEYIN